ncbi:uncharacterized protein FPRO_06747 [Fusarium proliferatum ET1]|uniref:Uncharacterized protein n=1 Tax=Fusarium proliferatum (strain ET1) TaxID=1227346 RepID=A0A1L7VCU5_FUSPR|nr:uncharacterized protein FPRO_06747 [Fusarium proliferatum ET1]CZR38062.1 uncharacterized protein FPRO_06747 [Fusarium proliferatum ET1]SCO42048.1 uncharacterized protein FFNC_08296 [Fusarium fujikuroi]SCV32668.1 uncharacterized protein FFFS_03406 [Fusarium fujikuroi]
MHYGMRQDSGVLGILLAIPLPKWVTTGLRVMQALPLWKCISSKFTATATAKLHGVEYRVASFALSPIT